jgi:hypothetical protein
MFKSGEEYRKFQGRHGRTKYISKVQLPMGLRSQEISPDGFCVASSAIISGGLQVDSRTLLTNVLAYMDGNLVRSLPLQLWFALSLSLIPPPVFQQLFVPYFAGGINEFRQAVVAYRQDMQNGWSAEIGEVVIWALSAHLQRPILVWDPRVADPMLISSGEVSGTPLLLAFDGVGHYSAIVPDTGNHSLLCECRCPLPSP